MTPLALTDAYISLGCDFLPHGNTATRPGCPQRHDFPVCAAGLLHVHILEGGVPLPGRASRAPAAPPSEEGPRRSQRQAGAKSGSPQHGEPRFATRSGQAAPPAAEAVRQRWADTPIGDTQQRRRPASAGREKASASAATSCSEHCFQAVTEEQISRLCRQLCSAAAVASPCL